MSGLRLVLVVLVVPWALALAAASASAQDDIEVEPEAPAPAETPTDDVEPPVIIKDPKLAKKLASAAAQFAQKGDYSMRRGKPDEAKAFYEQASNAYQKAIENGDDPNLFYDLAVVDEKLGKLDTAVLSLRVVLAATAGVKADIKKKAQAKHDDLTMKVGLVTLVVEQDDTTVTLAGRVLGKSPFIEPFVFLPGGYTLTFESDGYQPKDVEIKVEAGSEAERKIDLEPIKIVVAPPRDPESNEVTVEPTVIRSPSKLPLYIGGGVTIAAFGAFVVGGILAVGQHGTFVAEDSTRNERLNAQASGQNYALFSDIMLGTTLVAAGFTTFWYLFKYRKGNAKAGDRQSADPLAPTMSKVDVVPWVQPSASGFSVAGTF